MCACPRVVQLAHLHGELAAERARADEVEAVLAAMREGSSDMQVRGVGNHIFGGTYAALVITMWAIA